MKRQLLTLAAAAVSLLALAQNYDQDKPFGFCTRSSRSNPASIYDITGGGCYTYPVPTDYTGRVAVLTSNGQDMKNIIQNDTRTQHPLQC